MEERNKLSIFYFFSWLGKISKFFKGEYVKEERQKLLISVLGWLTSVLSFGLAMGGLLSWVMCRGNLPTVYDMLAILTDYRFWVLELFFTISLGVLFVFAPNVLPVAVSAIAIAVISVVAAPIILLIEAIKREWHKLSDESIFYGAIFFVVAVIGFVVSSIVVENEMTNLILQQMLDAAEGVLLVIPKEKWLELCAWGGVYPIVFGAMASCGTFFVLVGAIISFALVLRGKLDKTMLPVCGLVSAILSFVGSEVFVTLGSINAVNAPYMDAITFAHGIGALAMIVTGLMPFILGALGAIEAIIQKKKGETSVKRMVLSFISLGLACASMITCIVIGVVSIAM